MKFTLAHFRLPMLAAAALVISGCSASEAELAEKLAAVDAAAVRAEAAASRAEKAARTAGAPPAVVMEDEPEIEAEGEVVEDSAVIADSGPVPAPPPPPPGT